jgi:hypothetical protein
MEKVVYIAVLNDIDWQLFIVGENVGIDIASARDPRLFALSRDMIIGPQTVGTRGARYEVRCF